MQRSLFDVGVKYVLLLPHCLYVEMLVYIAQDGQSVCAKKLLLQQLPINQS